MKELFFSSVAEHIGIALLNSLWQGLIGVVLIIAVSRIVSPKYSTLRYWLFVGVMLIVFAANLITFSNQLLGSTFNDSHLVTNLTETIGLAQLTSTSASLATVKSFWSERIQLVMPYFVMLWWIGILALFIRMSVNLWQVRKLTRANHLPVSAQVLKLFAEAKLRLNINRAVKIVQSKQVMIPSVIGHLKPIILLPIGLVNGLASDQVEAILLHELSHIKRHDFLVNIIQSIIEVLYFFNPFMWIISKAIRDEREHACDDWAIALGISAPVYAETLAGVFNYAINRQQFTMSFASKNKLTLKRIQRIMKNQSNNNNKLITSMLFIVAISFSMYYGAQSQAPGQDFSDMLPDRTAMATAIPSFSPLSTPVLKPIEEEAVEEKRITKWFHVVEADTTDPKALKKRTEEYEKAMAGLKASDEWQEVERLRKDMMQEQMFIMQELTPTIEHALRLAEETMEIEQVQRIEIEKQLEIISEVMENLQFDEEMQRAYEMESRVMEETMREVRVQIEEIDIQKIEAMAQVHAEKAQIYAAEAKAIAKDAEKSIAEAKKQVEAVEDFFNELKPQLIKDGYLKSSEDLDQLRFKEGGVIVNGEKVKAKDAKKYYKIRDKYFAGEDFIMN